MVQRRAASLQQRVLEAADVGYHRRFGYILLGADKQEFLFLSFWKSLQPKYTCRVPFKKIRIYIYI